MYIDHMKNWNKTGKIKAIILGLVALPNLRMPIAVQGQEGFAVILIPLIFGSLAVPLTVKFNAFLFAGELKADME